MKLQSPLAAAATYHCALELWAANIITEERLDAVLDIVHRRTDVDRQHLSTALNALKGIYPSGYYREFSSLTPAQRRLIRSGKQ